MFLNLPLIPVGQAIVSEKITCPIRMSRHAEQASKDASFRGRFAGSMQVCQSPRKIPRLGPLCRRLFFFIAATSVCQKKQLVVRMLQRAFADIKNSMDASAGRSR